MEQDENGNSNEVDTQSKNAEGSACLERRKKGQGNSQLPTTSSVSWTGVTALVAALHNPAIVKVEYKNVATVGENNAVVSLTANG